MRTRSVLALALIVPLLATGCCVSKQELEANVQAWSDFSTAVEPDLMLLYLGGTDQDIITLLELEREAADLTEIKRAPRKRLFDLMHHILDIEEPSRTMRLGLLSDNRAAIAAATSRTRGK